MARFGSAYKKFRDNAIKALIVPFGEICWYCGISLKYREKHLDHIIPQSKGGTDDLDNLALSCKFCNRSKLDRDLPEFLEWLDFVRSDKSETKLDPEGMHPTSSLYKHV